mmetsp:Transcript_21306/g.50844  ORF Transcript_21306/g.50844 Transcript_21306/m.50844 type:complete len:81 (-) Transcript_21306:13-255(-)
MLMGWGQLLSLFLGRAETGARYMGEAPFAVATALAFGYFAAVLARNAKSLGLKSPLASLSRLQWPSLQDTGAGTSKAVGA